MNRDMANRVLEKMNSGVNLWHFKPVPSEYKEKGEELFIVLNDPNKRSDSNVVAVAREAFTEYRRHISTSPVAKFPATLKDNATAMEEWLLNLLNDNTDSFTNNQGDDIVLTAKVEMETEFDCKSILLGDVLDQIVDYLKRMDVKEVIVVHANRSYLGKEIESRGITAISAGLDSEWVDVNWTDEELVEQVNSRKNVAIILNHPEYSKEPNWLAHLLDNFNGGHVVYLGQHKAPMSTGNKHSRKVLRNKYSNLVTFYNPYFRALDDPSDSFIIYQKN